MQNKNKVHMCVNDHVYILTQINIVHHQIMLTIVDGNFIDCMQSQIWRRVKIFSEFFNTVSSRLFLIHQNIKEFMNAPNCFNGLPSV